MIKIKDEFKKITYGTKSTLMLPTSLFIEKEGYFDWGDKLPFYSRRKKKQFTGSSCKVIKQGLSVLSNAQHIRKVNFLN